MNEEIASGESESIDRDGAATTAAIAVESGGAIVASPTAATAAPTNRVGWPKRFTERFAERFGERFAERFSSPVLIKELRQAARGVFLFRALLFVQFAALALAVLMLLLDNGNAETSNLGQNLFEVAFACALFALGTVVPFFGFLSFGAERELATLDMLQLTRLRPFGIIVGKLAACGVLALEFMAALAPLGILAMLMPGLDPRVLLVTTLALPIGSVVLSAIAIGISGLAERRLARALLSVLLIVFLFIFAMIAYTYMRAKMGAFGARFDADDLAGVGFVLVLLAALGVFLLSAAIVQLTHREENRAFAPRVAGFVTTALLLVGSGVVQWSAGFSVVKESFHAGLMLLGLLPLAVILVFGATEAETLPRRARDATPANPILALLQLPFTTGGGRAIVWYLVAAGALIGGVSLMSSILSPSVDYSELLMAPSIAVYYTLAYVAGPAALVATSDRLKRRVRPRFWICALPIATLCFLSVAAYFTNGSDGVRDVVESSINFLWYLDRAVSQPDRIGHFGLVVWFLLAAAAVVINLPRIVKSVTETLAASAARRRSSS